MANVRQKFFVVYIVFSLLAPFGVYAQTGQHLGEARFLEYSIDYLSPLGITTVHEGGITYAPFGFVPRTESTFLSEEYFGEYALYFSEDTMPFCVNISNTGPRVFKNLKVETYQEFLDIAGNEGEPIGENNYHSWQILELGAYEEVRLCGDFDIPSVGSSGIDQTHLVISHQNSSGKKLGQVILEDFQAGLWCPTI